MGRLDLWGKKQHIFQRNMYMLLRGQVTCRQKVLNLSKSKIVYGHVVQHDSRRNLGWLTSQIMSSWWQDHGSSGLSHPKVRRWKGVFPTTEMWMLGSLTVPRQSRMMVPGVQTSSPKFSIVHWLPRFRDRETKPSWGSDKWSEGKVAMDSDFWICSGSSVVPQP